MGGRELRASEQCRCESPGTGKLGLASGAGAFFGPASVGRLMQTPMQKRLPQTCPSPSSPPTADLVQSGNTKQKRYFRAFRKRATPRRTCPAALAGYMRRLKPPQSLRLGRPSRACAQQPASSPTASANRLARAAQRRRRPSRLRPSASKGGDDGWLPRLPQANCVCIGLGWRSAAHDRRRPAAQLCHASPLVGLAAGPRGCCVRESRVLGIHFNAWPSRVSPPTLSYMSDSRLPLR
jgi:hypothetical protein